MRILFLTPPLTQLNTPYPATTALMGYFKNRGHDTSQADVGIELIHRLFTPENLRILFAKAHTKKGISESLKSILAQEKKYADCVLSCLDFLRGKNDSLAYRIVYTGFLPLSHRQETEEELEWAFGTLSVLEQALYLATLFIEDLCDLVQFADSSHFALISYGETLSLRLPELDPILETIEKQEGLVHSLIQELVSNLIDKHKPELVSISLPFPGTLLGGITISQYIRQNHPTIKIAWGGGYVNTELRELSDNRILAYTDYICLDDGETSFNSVIKHLEGAKDSILNNVFYADSQGRLCFASFQEDKYVPFCDCSVPDYSGLPLSLYMNTITLLNPMHSLWSNGRWNKLTLARGCYWGKCAFCDTSLPYVCNYEPKTAIQLCDEIEATIQQTGSKGFHFTDEAAPPALLKALSKELIKRGLHISWWTNIRFEKAFNMELCSLMADAGCIAVAGGLETASDRFLKLMNKGLSIEQAALTCQHLRENGIMVHAYLMYGFPCQGLEDCKDSLDIVRQFFEQGLLNSAFWHRYAMTVHSPSGKNPENYGAKALKIEKGRFANNEIPFAQPTDVNLEKVGEALRHATYNYMHQKGFDWDVERWFK